jgi:hypothetical protein
MIDQSEVADLIKMLESSKALKERLNVIDKDAFLNLIANETQPILISGDLKPYYQILPQGQMYFIRSLAIAPLTLDGEIIGSLNQADLSRLRYRPGMDTRLYGLAQSQGDGEGIATRIQAGRAIQNTSDRGLS